MAAPLELTPSARLRLRLTCYTLEGLNSLAAAYYFNYLFFYMRDHFGFGNRENLWLTAVHGFCYTLSAWNAGRFAQKFGYLFTLRLGFGGMGLALALGGLIPRWLGFQGAALGVEFGVLLLWTFSMCLTWPTLQAVLSRCEAAGSMARTAGTYNVVWAGCAAVSYLTGGALLEKFGGETLFWLPVGLHVLELILLLTLPRELPATPSAAAATPAAPRPNPRPIARVRTFLLLGWLANPFAYMAINGILPVIPKLADHLGLSHAYAGLVCSVWFWVRLTAFFALWFWPGWHYRFRWLLGAFVALALSFACILLSPNVPVLIAARFVQGMGGGSLTPTSYVAIGRRLPSHLQPPMFALGGMSVPVEDQSGMHVHRVRHHGGAQDRGGQQDAFGALESRQQAADHRLRRWRFDEETGRKSDRDDEQ